MIKFTLLAAAALTFGETAANAQTMNEVISARKAGLEIVKTMFAGHSTTAGIKKAESQTANWMPAKTTTYSYANSNWTKYCSDAYTYNKNGNVESNENYSTDGNTRTVYTYDEKSTSILTKTTVYSWDATTSTWTGGIVTAQNDLTRNSNGQISKVITYAYDEDKKGLAKVIETEYGYDSSNTLNNISMQMEVEETGSVSLKLSNIQWASYNPDAILNINDMDDLFSVSGNLIKSANVSMSMQGMTFGGTITGSYTDTSASMTLNLDMASMTYKVNIVQKQTDKNGSYEMTTTSQMATLTNIEKVVATADDKGNYTDEVVYTGTNANNLEIEEAYSHDHKYDAEGRLSSTITSSYNTETKTYSYTQKITYDEYVNTATGINTLENNTKNSATSQNNGVYGLDGTFVGKYLNKANKGFYIVKKDGKTMKVAVK